MGQVWPKPGDTRLRRKWVGGLHLTAGAIALLCSVSLGAEETESDVYARAGEVELWTLPADGIGPVELGASSKTDIFRL